MPWILTTPVAVGDLDPLGPYQQVRIVRQAHDSVRRVIAVDLEYGNTVNDQWKPGLPVRTKPTNVIVQGTDYDTLVSTATPQTGEKTYEAVKRGLYEFLRDQNIIGPGVLA